MTKMDEHAARFKEWADSHKPGVAYVLKSNTSYFQTWLARQPEIDARKAENEKLRNTLESVFSELNAKVPFLPTWLLDIRNNLGTAMTASPDTKGERG